MAHKYNASDYVFQFVTIMAGVLIAMLANGFVERSRDRGLVAQARATLQREIADNRKDLELTVATLPKDLQALDNAIQFATEVLTTGKTGITSLQLNYNMADLFDTSWRTAERTGALSHMDYPEVQRYSMLYDFQEFFMTRQREAIAILTSATALIGPGFNPDKPNRKDLESFRERTMALRAALRLQQDFAARLAEYYSEALQQ